MKLKLVVYLPDVVMFTPRSILIRDDEYDLIQSAGKAKEFEELVVKAYYELRRRSEEAKKRGRRPPANQLKREIMAEMIYPFIDPNYDADPEYWDELRRLWREQIAEMQDPNRVMR